jgi:hypothetical protein
VRKLFKRFLEELAMFLLVSIGLVIIAVCFCLDKYHVAEEETKKFVDGVIIIIMSLASVLIYLFLLR